MDPDFCHLTGKEMKPERYRVQVLAGPEILTQT